MKADTLLYYSVNISTATTRSGTYDTVPESYSISPHLRTAQCASLCWSSPGTQSILFSSLMFSILLPIKRRNINHIHQLLGEKSAKYDRMSNCIGADHPVVPSASLSPTFHTNETEPSRVGRRTLFDRREESAALLLDIMALMCLLATWISCRIMIDVAAYPLHFD
jgi:hypothetical protein